MDKNNIKEYFDERAKDWDKFVPHNCDKIRYILSLFDIQKNCKILDAGCGTGILENFLTEYSNDITAVDFSENMLSLAKEKFLVSGINFLCADLFDITEKFDLIFLYSIYPHIFDKQKLAEKLYEILNKNGVFIIFHTDGKEAINNMHNIKADELSVKIKPIELEKTHFNKLFNVNRGIDTIDYFLLSGVKK